MLVEEDLFIPREEYCRYESTWYIPILNHPGDFPCSSVAASTATEHTFLRKEGPPTTLPRSWGTRNGAAFGIGAVSSG